MFEKNDDYTKLDNEVAELMMNGGMLSDIVTKLFPVTNGETSFEQFYKQTKLPLGTILKEHINNKDNQ